MTNNDVNINDLLNDLFLIMVIGRPTFYNDMCKMLNVSYDSNIENIYMDISNNKIIVSNGRKYGEWCISRILKNSNGYSIYSNKYSLSLSSPVLKIDKYEDNKIIVTYCSEYLKLYEKNDAIAFLTFLNDFYEKNMNK